MFILRPHSPPPHRAVSGGRAGAEYSAGQEGRREGEKERRRRTFGRIKVANIRVGGVADAIVSLSLANVLNGSSLRSFFVGWCAQRACIARHLACPLSVHTTYTSCSMRIMFPPPLSSPRAVNLSQISILLRDMVRRVRRNVSAIKQPHVWRLALKEHSRHPYV
jgi:hypothetical protein